MKEALIVSARKNFIIVDSYGKNSVNDKTAITTTAGVTKATVTAGGKANIGDALYVYPYMISGSAVSLPTIGKVVSLRIRYPKTQKGSVLKDFKYTFSAVPATLAALVTELNSELTKVGLNGYVEFVLVGTKILIQAKRLMTTFGINADNTFEMNLPLDSVNTAAGKATFAHQVIFTLAGGLAVGDTEVILSPIHETVKDSVYALTAIRYEVFKNMGESTSSTLDVADTATSYSGNSLMAKQVEYLDGTISFKIEEQEFLFDNLEIVKNWSKSTAPQSPYGATMAEGYTLKGDSTPNDISIISFGHDVNDVLNTIYMERAKSQSLTVALNKTEFRVYSDTITPLVPDNKIVVGMAYQK